MNEMNEKLSFKIGMKFAALIYMGENILDILYKVTAYIVQKIYQYKDEVDCLKIGINDDKYKDKVN